MTLTTPDDRRAPELDGGDPRQALIRAAVDEYRVQAFHLVTLQSVADRAGLPVEQAMLHFPAVEDLVQVVVSTWYAARMAAIMPIAEQAGAVRFLRAVVVANIADPALMRLLSALVNICATEDHPMAPRLQQQWMRFHALVQRTLAEDVAVGREPATMDPACGAEQLIALYEGLQVQALVRPAMNLLGAYDRGVARLRAGWAQPFAAPVWEI